MRQKRTDILGIGNAIVDVLSQCDDSFFETDIAKEANLQKGGMALIGENEAAALYEAEGQTIQISGGSAANTMVGLANFGCKADFIGKVCDDDLGQVFGHDIKSAGVNFSTTPAKKGESAATAQSIILVTPDAERTMATFLGACLELSPDDIIEEQIAKAKYIYIEGYLWDPPLAKEAIRKAIDFAQKHDVKISLSLSDPFCVDRHREEFLELICNHIDVLFCNKDEILSLYETDDFEKALDEIAPHTDIAAITKGAEGAVIVNGDERISVAAKNMGRVIDTTGAGDLFAAGFLAGMIKDKNLFDAGNMGSVAAAEIISHMGARPEADLKELSIGYESEFG